MKDNKVTTSHTHHHSLPTERADNHPHACHHSPPRPIPASKPTVKDMIMDRLLAGGTVSPLQALQEFGCLSLPQRISELRARGEPIKGRLVTTANGKRHNIYWIEPQDRPPHKDRT